MLVRSAMVCYKPYFTQLNTGTLLKVSNLVALYWHKAVNNNINIGSKNSHAKINPICLDRYDLNPYSISMEASVNSQ